MASILGYLNWLRLYGSRLFIRLTVDFICLSVNFDILDDPGSDYTVLLESDFIRLGPKSCLTILAWFYG